jgi:predicted negative regulator of RcsB-dependent stress response
MARLATAELDIQEKQYDKGIAALRELSLDTKGDMPVDAVLSQLGNAYAAAGKKTEAQQTFQRLTSEFASSPYAADARKQLDALKAKS